LLLKYLTNGHHTLDLSRKIPFGKDVSTTTTTTTSDIMNALIDELRTHPSIATGVTSVILDSIQLESLPEDLLLLLPNARTISLKKNCLDDLPSSLQQSCLHLKELNISQNQLTYDALSHRIPDLFQSNTIGDGDGGGDSFVCRSLTKIDFSCNLLSSFPVNISTKSFPNLQVINLFNNGIVTVHDWISLPSSLTTLDISENSIEDMEPLVMLLAAHCPQLQYLSLMHNNIRCIPSSTGLLRRYNPCLSTVNLHGNPQQGIRPNILQKACTDLLKYIENRLTPEQLYDMIDKIESKRGIIENEGSRGSGDGDHKNNDVQSPVIENAEKANSTDLDLLKRLERSIREIEIQLEKESISQAKKYALKKALAMERSKLIREERRLGLRK
jgi:Leucine-rich repeat (LRR) protein